MNIGDKLFDFEAVDIKGKRHSPKEMYRQFAVVVLFFSSKCSFSQAYAKRIESLAVRFESDDLAIYLIDVEPCDTYHIEDHFTDFKLMPHPNFVHIVDEGGVIARQFGAQVTPTAFLFDRKRELVYKGMIDDNWEHPDFVMRVYLNDAIDYTLDGMDNDFPETEPVGTPIECL